MPQQPAELSPLLFNPSPELPSTPTRETPPTTPTSEPTAVPLANTIPPEDPPQPPKKKWKRQILAFTISIIFPASVLTAILFLGGDSYNTVSGLPKGENGVSSYVTIGQGSSTKWSPQVAILGDAVRFDSLGTQLVSVRWYVVGYGEYGLRTVGGSPAKHTVSVNRAVDVYLDE